MNSPGSFLRIEDLTKTYNRGTPQEVIALDHLNLSVERGDFVSIIGSNGSGKSSLLNSIAGSIKMTEGKIYLDGNIISNKPLYARASQISRVYQDPKAGASPSMTVEENLLLASLRGKGASLRLGISASRRSTFIKMVKQLGIGLENRLTDRVANLSGGERQALTMMMATIVRPQLLLLDEHCAALDPRMSHLIMMMTKNLVETYRFTTLMVTHDMELALKYGNRLVMLHRGKIVDDLSEEAKKRVTEEDLIEKFRQLKHREEIFDNTNAKGRQ